MTTISWPSSEPHSDAVSGPLIAARLHPFCSLGPRAPFCFPSAVWKASCVFISPGHTHIGVDGVTTLG